ncbi:MAG: NUDIX hydrolase [Dermatophilaceae bacterium]
MSHRGGLEPPIEVSAVVLRDVRGRVLTVRKRGSHRFMLPGGKPEPGETAANAAVRECLEELSAQLSPTLLVRLGTFVADAANEGGRRVQAEVFEHPMVRVDGPAAELEELRWLDPDAPLPLDLAPLLVEHVLPQLAAAPPR